MDAAEHQILLAAEREAAYRAGWAEGLRTGWRKALLFFLKKQILRHEADNVITRRDVEALEAMGVTLARDPEAGEWIEVTDEPLEL